MVYKIFLVENKGKDSLPCPECGEDWMYGWQSPAVLKEFLAEQVNWRCGKCRRVFPRNELES